MASTKKKTSVKVTKKPVKKTVSSAAKTTAVKKALVSKPVKQKEVKHDKPVKVVASEVHGLTASVMGVDGTVKGKMTLPKEVFDEPENKQLTNQAVRVFLANQRQGGANTKTRGEVEGSTRKIYNQKGTGRARHGSIRAHIFVGGGIVFGPVTHDFSLTMPTKMKRKALASALTSQYKAGNVVFIDGLEKLEPKTKFMAKAIKAVSDTQSILLVLAKDTALVARIARNIDGLDMLPASNVSTYDILSHKKIVFMKDAVSIVKDTITKVA